jgi:putative ABC transport system permease protein
MKFLLLIVKNVARSPLRSILTVLGSMVLVMVVTGVWSMLWLMDLVTAEKKENFKAIVMDRWSATGWFPLPYEDILREGAAIGPKDVKPLDYMTWQIYVGSVDPKKMVRENLVIAIALDPAKVTTMMEGLDAESLSADERQNVDGLVAALQKNPQGIVVGENVLKALNKRVGERIKVFGTMTFKGLDFEFEILGTFPTGRYDGFSVMHRDYMNNVLDLYPKNNNGRKHLLSDRRARMTWLKVADTAAFTQLAKQIEGSPQLRAPYLKCETASSSMAGWLEGFRDMLWGMRWILAPGCLVSLSLVIANAISISVRERRQELAVLKVLGFRPYQLLVLVLGESLLLGVGAGVASAALTYGLVNYVLGGIPFPLGFFPRFFVPPAALWWGPAIGVGTALIGSLWPAWSARNVKVADVFAKVA